MDRVLLVDDDVQLCKLLAERLSTEGFTMETVNDGSRGLELAMSTQYALVVLDLMLPGMGGLDVLRRLRKASPVPVLILTARGEDSDRILGLEMGADDYVQKPFNPRELIARIRAILRRTGATEPAAGPKVVGDIRIDPAVREAWLEDALLNLTSVEFALLEAFMRKPGRVLSREHLTDLAVVGLRLERRLLLPLARLEVRALPLDRAVSTDPRRPRGQHVNAREECPVLQDTAAGDELP